MLGGGPGAWRRTRAARWSACSPPETGGPGRGWHAAPSGSRRIGRGAALGPGPAASCPYSTRPTVGDPGPGTRRPVVPMLHYQWSGVKYRGCGGALPGSSAWPVSELLEVVLPVDRAAVAVEAAGVDEAAGCPRSDGCGGDADDVGCFVCCDPAACVGAGHWTARGSGTLYLAWQPVRAAASRARPVTGRSRLGRRLRPCGSRRPRTGWRIRRRCPSCATSGCGRR
jgi:hypothetical protein